MFSKGVCFQLFWGTHLQIGSSKIPTSVGKYNNSLFLNQSHICSNTGKKQESTFLKRAQFLLQIQPSPSQTHL